MSGCARRSGGARGLGDGGGTVRVVHRAVGRGDAGGPALGIESLYLALGAPGQVATVFVLLGRTRRGGVASANQSIWMPSVGPMPPSVFCRHLAIVPDGLRIKCVAVILTARNDDRMNEQVAQSFNTNMRASARRHQEAAETLHEGARQDVAGYLYGLAAECGIKALMLDLGMRPTQNPRTSDDPFYAHFTRLKTILSYDVHARQHSDLRKFIEDKHFMEYWDIAMRYSDGKDIKKAWVDGWRQNAKDVVAEL